MKRLTLIAAFAIAQTHIAAAQKPFTPARGIAAFSIWQPKEGQESRFETGYKQHLQWHQRSGDKWDWYGWYVISGKNYGQFVDATFDHSWSDFMAPVNPAGDGADNDLHTEPFGTYLGGFKLSRIEEASITDTAGLRTKFSRLITLKVNDLTLAEKILTRLKEKYTGNSASAASAPTPTTPASPAVKNFQCFRLIDGGDLNQMIILIGLADLTQFDNTEHIPADLSEIEHASKTNVIREIESELLAFKSDMSLIAR